MVLLVLLALLCGCLGCGKAGAQASAIELAIENYSGYYFEVHDLSKQVRTQYKSLADDETPAYTIAARVPDYVSIDPSSVSFDAPALEYSDAAAATYRLNAQIALRMALESLAMNSPELIPSYTEVPLQFDLVSSDGGWKGTLTSESINSVKSLVDQMVDDLLPYYASENLRQCAIVGAKKALLSELFGSGDYLSAVEIKGIEAVDEGEYDVTLTYPDPSEVYAEVAEVYFNSYDRCFFGEKQTVTLSIEKLSGVDLTALNPATGTIKVSCDENGENVALLDASDIAASLAEAKSKAESSATERVNATWYIAEQTPPKSGTIVYGTSKGNRVVCNTESDGDAYYFIRFYALDSDDVTQNGKLHLSVFIQAGKRAAIYLPTGYYRIVCATGETWYGADYRFGPDGSYYQGETALRTQGGYYNDLNFGTFQGNVDTSSLDYLAD